MGQDAWARALLERAIELHRLVGDDHTRAVSLANLATVVARQGNVAAGQALLQQAIDLFEQVGDADEKAKAIANLAHLTTGQN